MKHLIRQSLLLSLALTVSGCAVASAGVKKGDERNLARTVQDGNAERKIKARMKRAHDFELKGVNVEAAEGIVLLTGSVPNQTDKIEAARIAWSASGIEQVGNEILIMGQQSFARNTKDGFLETAVKTRLTADRLVKARNFNIETHEGIVYVMGVARTQEELKRAAEIAATTKGAREVISYAKIANLTSTPEPDYSTQYAAPSVSQPQAYTPQAYSAPTQRALPSILQSAPDGQIPSAPSYQAQLPAPITNAPLGQPIPFSAPTAPSEIHIGDRLGVELPSDQELGAFRTGQAGEAISIIESAPYYVDPDTGKEIPIRFDSNGNLIPRVIN